jgi:DNA-binding transcriptional regulator GbsR (MarR family)
VNCTDAVTTAMKGRIREFTIPELMEETGYSYGTLHLALKNMVKAKKVKRRKLKIGDRRFDVGAPGYAYWRVAKKQAPKKAA